MKPGMWLIFYSCIFSPLICLMSLQDITRSSFGCILLSSILQCVVDELFYSCLHIYILPFGWTHVGSLLGTVCFLNPHMRRSLRSYTRHSKTTSGLSNLSFLELVLPSLTTQERYRCLDHYTCPVTL